MFHNHDKRLVLHLSLLLQVNFDGRTITKTIPNLQGGGGGVKTAEGGEEGGEADKAKKEEKAQVHTLAEYC